MMARILVNEHNFETEVANSKVPTLVDFYTPACGPCKSLAVMLDKLEKIMEGRIKVVAVNAEESPDLSRRLGVRGVPTLVLFYQGSLIDTRTGILLPPQLRDWVSASLPAKALE